MYEEAAELLCECEGVRGTCERCIMGEAWRVPKGGS